MTLYKRVILHLFSLQAHLSSYILIISFFIHFVIFVLACFSCVNATCRMFRGTCYTWSEMSMSWYQARTWCRDREAQILHPRFLPAVRQFLGVQYGPRGRFYWIGLKTAHWYINGKIGKQLSQK